MCKVKCISYISVIQYIIGHRHEMVPTIDSIKAQWDADKAQTNIKRVVNLPRSRDMTLNMCCYRGDISQVGLLITVVYEWSIRLHWMTGHKTLNDGHKMEKIMLGYDYIMIICLLQVSEYSISLNDHFFIPWTEIS